MKSGLGDRNNCYTPNQPNNRPQVSMKSGLGDRNNGGHTGDDWRAVGNVSMKSGLGDRNNM